MKSIVRLHPLMSIRRRKLQASAENRDTLSEESSPDPSVAGDEKKGLEEEEEAAAARHQNTEEGPGQEKAALRTETESSLLLVLSQSI